MRILASLLLLVLSAAAHAGEGVPDVPLEDQALPVEDRAVPAPPAPLPPGEAATRAQAAHDSYCGTVSGEAEALAAQATSDVGDVWSEVVRSHEASGAVYLLYWRGLLARCLRHDDRAKAALSAFLAADLDGQGLDGMRRDAQIRLRRLQKDAGDLEVPLAVRRASAAVGVALAVTSAATGALAAWQADHFSVNRSDLTTLRHSTADADALIAAGDQHLGAAIGLGVGSVGSLIGSVAAFAGSRPRARSRVGARSWRGVPGRVAGRDGGPRASAPAAWLVPTEGGLAVGVGWRW